MDAQMMAVLAGGGVAGGAVLENFLEHACMDHVPVKLRPYVPLVVGVIMAVVANKQLGMSWQEAAYAAIVTVGTAYMKHDLPATAAVSEKASNEQAPK
jgi:hypothetical protein